MARGFLLIGFAVLTGVAFAAPEPATHEPTLIGNASRSVSPAGYVYTDPPTPFGVPSGLRAKARHARKAPPTAKTARR
jgi:hypothetical protein